MNLVSFLSDLDAGGLIGFAGGTNVFKAGPGALLSDAIEHLTHSRLSHIGVVPPTQYWGTPNDPVVIESTIWPSHAPNVSGPQLNELTPRLTLDYEAHGGHAWFRPVLPQFEPAWEDLWTQAESLFALVKEGKLHYSVERLLGDATERNVFFEVLPIAGILEHLSEHDHGVVCSECAALLLQAGHMDAKAKAAGVAWLPTVEPVAGQAIGAAPEDLWEMPLWAEPITLL